MATRLLLVKCFDNKMVKSPGWPSIGPSSCGLPKKSHPTDKQLLFVMLSFFVESETNSNSLLNFFVVLNIKVLILYFCWYSNNFCQTIHHFRTKPITMKHQKLSSWLPNMVVFVAYSTQMKYIFELIWLHSKNKYLNT